MGKSARLRQKFSNKLCLVNCRKMAKKEGLCHKDIVSAFLIKKCDGAPKNGKEHRRIQQLIAQKDIPGLKEILKREKHWPTRAMIIRNIALVRYAR